MNATPNPPIILASASPRRHELVRLLDVPFTVRTADVDETPRPDETPAQTVARLSRTKAAVVAEAVVADRTSGLVIAADTLVVLEGEILGKPRDANEAEAILRRLRDRSHQVLTGVTVLDTRLDAAETLVTSTDVWMRDYADEEIAQYVASGDPLDKAGAYAIQYEDFAPVARLDGCPASVMGLPVCKLDASLRTCGLDLKTTPVQTCRPAANDCAIRELVVPS